MFILIIFHIFSVLEMSCNGCKKAHLTEKLRIQPAFEESELKQNVTEGVTDIVTESVTESVTCNGGVRCTSSDGRLVTITCWEGTQVRQDSQS